MKLYASLTSPYGRKVRMAAHELGLAERVTLVETQPVDVPAAKNPLNKVPALELDDGSPLYDSPVICEYLDHLAGGQKLFPAPGPARWLALRQQALADGLCDAAVLRMQEGRRPAQYQFPDWIARQKRKVDQSLGELEANVPGAVIDIGTISILVALDYLDFRFAADDWKAGHPRMAAWFAKASDRDSFRLTIPVG